MNIYEQKGFKDRFAYLRSLADQYGIDFTIVAPIAAVLGENEDFDGLISELEDIAGGN